MRGRTPTLAQQAQAEVRRARFRTLADQIAQLSPDERLAMAARMSITTIEGHPLSIHNACLAGAQRPDATMVGGFGQWIKAGRCVRKGEHGIMIWAPTVRRETTTNPDAETRDEQTTSTRRSGFIMVTVFDVSQTDMVQERASR